MEHETRAIEKRDGRRRQLEGSNQTVPLWKLFTFADRLDIVLIAVGTIGAVVAGAPLPIFSYIFGEILDGLGEGGRSTTEQGSHALVQKVSQASLRAFLVGVGSGVGFFFELVCWTIIGERQASRIKTMYLKSLLRQDVSFFDKEISTGEVLDKMSGDTLYIQQATGDKAGKIIQLLSTVACGFLIAFIKGWKLTLVTLATIPLIIGSGVAMALAVSKAASRAQAATAEAGTIVEQVISAIRTVAAFTGERRAIKEYNQALEKANKANKQQALVSGLGLGTILFFTFCSYALTFSFGSWLIIHDRYSGGTVMTVLFAIIIGSGALGQSLPCWGVFTHGRAAAYKMFRIIQRVPIIDVYDTKGLVLNHVEGEIELQNVFFAYPARPEFQVFSGFSLKVPKGTTAAIVGESGSGKSTIISLIERFYDPQDGKVLVDGIDIKNLQLSWLREQIGLVTQETVLIGTSIRENILYGKEEATFEEIETAAELANAAKFIKELPEGYDTLVGGLGMQLSGGQKQRLAIARAILKNPCILLLDEATSALDTESERIVHKALQQVMINRTTVMVTHRLRTIKYADYIAVLQHGSIVEIGSHKELSADPDSIYSRLIKLHDTTQICDENREQLHDNKFSRSATSRQLYSFGNVDHVMSEDIYHNSSDFLDRIDLQVWGKTGNTGDLEMGSTRGANKDVHLWRLASLNKSEVPVILLGSIAAAINGIIMPLTGFLLANMIHTFYDPPHKLQEDCRFWVAMFLAIAFASLVVSPTQNFCMNVAGIRLIHRLRLMTFERVIGQDISWFDRKGNSSGIVSASLSGDAAELRNMVGDALALVAQNMATVTASLVISFSASWQLTLVLLALLPLLSLEGWTQLKLTDACSTQAKAINEKTNNIIHEVVSSIRIVASLCAESRILELYKQKNQASLKSGIRRGFIGGIGLGLSNTLMCASFACSFWVGVHLIANGKITGNQFLKVFFVIQLSAVAVSQSTALAPDISKMKAAVSSVFALIDQKSKIDPFDSSGTRIEQVKGAIEIRHLIFWYPMRPNVPIFHNLSLTIDSGKIVALVGESGGGKSSLISLLQRFYDPQSGEILLDNVNIKKLQLKWLRQQMGLVNQEPFLFDDTIRANIQYGKDDVISDEDMEKAATIANAHNFISELPEGYNTRVGERGIQLSGGQKQRIAIARALIRNPRILLLDEATSALDVECERVVQEALDRFMAGRTTIVIAHRLSTIRNSHVIVVMKDGAILEQGSHEKLIAQQNGHYASLVGNSTGG